MSAPALSERGGDSLVASGGERQGRIKDVSRFQIGTVNERVILFIRDTGLYEQFWYWRALGSVSMGLDSEVPLGSSRCRCQGWSLKFRSGLKIWELPLIYLLLWW